MKDDWIYGAKAIAGALGVSRRTLHRWLEADGHSLPVVHIGGRLAAQMADLRGWKGKAFLPYGAT